MKPILRAIWTEPAVAIGLATSLLLVLLAVVDGTDWTVSVIAGVAAPFLSALGIRQAVTPAAGPREEES